MAPPVINDMGPTLKAWLEKKREMILYRDV
jgi:hypothetical protein